jgi:protein involved in polysaccharide export with SLBB domain
MNLFGWTGPRRRRPIRLDCKVFLLLPVLATATACRDPNRGAGDSPSRPTGSRATLAVGDVVRVRLFDSARPGAALVEWVRVQPDGSLALPFATTAGVAGATESEASAKVTAEYRRRELGIGPEVSVTRESGWPSDPRIRGGDLIWVSITTVPGPGLLIDGYVERSVVTVPPDGQVHVPMAQTVRVGGMTDGEAQRALNDRLKRMALSDDSRAVVLRIAGQPGGDTPLAPGDLLRIAVRDLTAPNRNDGTLARVGRDGTVTAPLLSPIVVAGKTPFETEALLASAYRKANLIEVADVSVLRLEPAPAAGGGLLDAPLHPIPEPLATLLRATE